MRLDTQGVYSKISAPESEKVPRLAAKKAELLARFSRVRSNKGVHLSPQGADADRQIGPGVFGIISRNSASKSYLTPRAGPFYTRSKVWESFPRSETDGDL